ncbi:hypothetical protein Nepgr_002803 [Nepenthes gracilis]|uniref:Uncharacterized protein n=1 Tax=Nepenthes gracilis TaxID=150966 RepID=A0AAD3RY20_NEPGR|nr:hypothetical protein Nepgr_002803 [Nepenthes gracilis]
MLRSFFSWESRFQTAMWSVDECSFPILGFAENLVVHFVSHWTGWRGPGGVNLVAPVKIHPGCVMAVGGVVVPILLLAVDGAFTQLIALAMCVVYDEAIAAILSPASQFADAAVSLVDSLGVGLLPFVGIRHTQ